MHMTDDQIKSTYTYMQARHANILKMVNTMRDMLADFAEQN